MARIYAIARLHYGFKIPKSGTGADFITSTIEAGGEGVVAKPIAARFGRDWLKIKRVETYDVRITAKLQNAVAIEFENQAAGKCPIYGANHEAARIGGIIEIAAMRRNASGKFREPRFLKFRSDKIRL